MASSLSFLLMNIRGLFSLTSVRKIPFLADIVIQNNIPLIALTETWLEEGILDAEVERQIPGYKILRSDRIGRPRGGVAIYLRDD